ncbi:MAG TPA: indole-3-glycerol phosphate synthase TrpC [Vicinamibacterales bacterium]|nr:indole-3-glycerol phosphate synthase TrpC [Vicinamibacterales bacterium]
MTQTATAAPDLLATIVAAARRMTEVRRAATPEATLAAYASRRRPNGARFVRALRDSHAPRVIAECKRRSPSRGILRADYRPEEHAVAYVGGGAAAISVLTEPTFFDGSLDHLAAIRQVVSAPLLRKDFIVERYQVTEAAAYGADAILLIAGALSPAALRERLADAAEWGLAALVEIHDRAELEMASEAGAEVIGVNSRNLRTLAVQPELHEALAFRLPAHVTAVAESGLRDAADITRLTRAGYHAFLVGERLIAEPDPGAALRALRGKP